jgi:succinoglycan biosynthesis transport protein ExoP
MTEPTAADAVASVTTVLWRRKLIISVTFVVAVGLALVFSALQERQYAATATLLINALDESPFDDRVGPQTPDVNAAIERLGGVEVRRAVHRELAADAEQLRGVDFSQRPETQLVDITVRATDAGVARSAADLFADSFVALRAQARQEVAQGRSEALREQATALQAQVDATVPELTAALADASPVAQARAELLQSRLSRLEEQVTDYNLRADRELAGVRVSGNEGVVVTRAQRSTTPSQPTPVRSATLAGLLGLLVGLGAAFLRESLDQRVRDELSLARLLPHGASVTTVPRSRRVAHRKGDPDAGVPGSPTTDAFGRLAYAVSTQLTHDDKVVTCVPVGSDLNARNHGMVTAAQLALALARSGRQVGLIDCSYSATGVAALLDLPEGPGLSDALIGRRDTVVEVHTVDTTGASLQVITAGTDPASGASFVGTSTFSRLLAHHRQEWEIAILSSPPFTSAGASGLARLSQGAVLAVRPGLDYQPAVREVVASLAVLKVPVLAAIMAEPSPLGWLPRGPAEHANRPTTPVNEPISPAREPV